MFFIARPVKAGPVEPMLITVTGKQMDVGDSLRGHVDAVTRAIVEKYFGRAIEAHVVFYHEGHLISSDVSVHAGRGLLVQCHGASEDAYAAFDSAADRLDKRLRRYKRRLRNHHKSAREAGDGASEATDYVLAPADDETADDSAGDQPLVIAEMRTSIPRLSVSEAVMRLDLADLPVLLFRNSARGALNLIYRRRDGNVGWIDPDLGAQSRETTARKGS